MSDLFKFTKPVWEQLKDKKLFETPIFSLHELKLKPEKIQSIHPFYILRAPAWVNVIPLTAGNDIILVEQYRAGIDRPTLELPGGMVDDGEVPLDSAKRELAEETGYTSRRWEKLGKTSSNPAIMNNFAHLFVARDCNLAGKPAPDCTEDISIHTLPLHTFFRLVQEGTVHHSIVLAAVAQFILTEYTEYFK